MKEVKIYYKSSIARLFTFLKGFSIIMLFGMIFTEKEGPLSTEERLHETTHVNQYWDCFILGLGFVGFMFIISVFGGIIGSSFLYWLLLPPLLYYIWYLIEYTYNRLIKKMDKQRAYRNIKFEIHARKMATESMLPPNIRTEYKFLCWVIY